MKMEFTLQTNISIKGQIEEKQEKSIDTENWHFVQKQHTHFMNIACSKKVSISHT